MRFTVLIFGSYLFFSLIETSPSNQIAGKHQAIKSLTFLASLKGCNTGKENQLSASPGTDSNFKENVVTPEMFGAIGDGKIHKLSDRYNTIDAARKEFPRVKDLNVTIDGAAFQKAIDVAAENKGEVIAEKNYAINFPLITRSNIIIDGKNKGVIYNDKSRRTIIDHVAFFLGDHSSAAFYKTDNNSDGYILYDVKGSVSAGQNYVQLANPSNISSFKTGQLVMVISAFKRKVSEKKALLPYHITMSKIVRIDGSKLYFEYPIDEVVDSVQIAANGNYDRLTGIKFEGVENVTLRNLTVDAENLSLRSYGYKCRMDNIKIINATRVIGLNAMAHSTITNISGTFAWRGIEIKTGSSDLLVRNVTATYKAIPGYSQCIDVISLGEYNRNITIDSFNIDIGSQNLKHALIDLHARKATISNGTITGKNHTKPFIKFYNERYVNDPKFGCYANKIYNVKFYGSTSMKSVMEMGDEENNKNEIRPPKKNWAREAKPNKKNNQRSNNEEDETINDAPFTANVPPTANIVENCLFDGGSSASSVNLNQGEQNVIRNSVFTRAKLKVASTFRNKNTIGNNKEND